MMRNRPLPILSSLPLALFLLPMAARPAHAKVVGPPEVAWKDMSFKAKKAYMKEAVVPKMKEVFQAFDGKKFAKVNCQTCHGEDGPDRKYKMPSHDIHPLPNTPESFQAKMKKEPTWPKFTEFMGKQVEPAMGVLLDVPVFNPQKPVEGAFGCSKCHKLETVKP
jgi:mono/diheme cytochrome c family protein